MLWHNSGDGTFLDVAEETGTCDADWGWGAKFVDVDNDGRLDLYVANGLISAGKESYWNALTQLLLRPGFEMTDAAQWPDMAGMSWAGYEQKRLFHNRGADGFAETAVSAGVGNLKDGRGVALLDIENDGALDMFVTNWNQEPILYRNEGRRKTGNNFVGLKLRGTVSNKSASIAKIRGIQSEGGGIYVYEALQAAAAMISPSKAGTRHIVLFSDGVPDFPGAGRMPAPQLYAKIDVSPIEYLSRNVTIRLLYAQPTVAQNWEKLVPRNRVKIWTQDEQVMAGWHRHEVQGVAMEQQDSLWSWTQQIVDFRVRRGKIL